MRTVYFEDGSISKSKIIPRLISLLGLFGYILLLTGSVLEIFGLIDTNGRGMIINIPLSIFEIILLPVWLIVKGFNPVSMNSGFKIT